MKQTTIVILLFGFLISCDNKIAKPRFLETTDSLKYVVIEDTILSNFISEYITRNNESKGIFIVHTSSDIMERKEYIIVKSVSDFTSDSIAPLTFTKINGIPVFFYSGIDNFFPSINRYKHYLTLSKDYLKEGVIYCGYPGEIVFCGTKVDRINYQADRQPDNNLSCVKIAGSVKFFVPKVSEDSIE